MYKCMDCGCVFEESEMEHWREPHGEELDGCPICYGAVEEMTFCKNCNEWRCTSDDEISGVCEECRKETIKKFQKLILENFTEEEKEILRESYPEELI